MEKRSFPLGLNPGGWRLEVQEGTLKTGCFRKRSQAKERGPDNLCLLPQISPTPGLFRSEPLNLHFVLQLDGDRVCSSQSKQHDTPVQATCSSLSFCEKNQGRRAVQQNGSSLYFYYILHTSRASIYFFSYDRFIVLPLFLKQFPYLDIILFLVLLTFTKTSTSLIFPINIQLQKNSLVSL